MEQNNPWKWNGQILTQDIIPCWAVGMVYCIIDEYMHLQMGRDHGVVYVGKKLLHSTRKQKISKRDQAKEKAETGDGRVHKVRRVVQSSGWQTYMTSSPEVQQLLKKHPERYSRVVIEFAHGKKHLSYLEEHYMHHHKVLERDTYNHNIGGRYYRKDMDKPEPK